MTSLALKKEIVPADVREVRQENDLTLPLAGTAGHASPVHQLQARLENAVFASFSAKEQVETTARHRLRSAGVIVAAALGAWGLLLAGAALSFH